MLRRVDILHKCVSFASSSFILLQLDKFQLAKGLEDILKIALSDAEVNITNVKPVEWRRVLTAGTGLGVTCLAVLFRFGQLRDDGNAQKLLSGELNRGLNGLLVPKFNVTDTEKH
jgi:hypothetical protein